MPHEQKKSCIAAILRMGSEKLREFRKIMTDLREFAEARLTNGLNQGGPPQGDLPDSIESRVLNFAV